MLENKYLKYSPEITLEIFTLVWNKLEYIYAESYNDSIFQRFQRFQRFQEGGVVRLSLQGRLGVYTQSLYNAETTVQEILGYDPFIKEDFVLPEKWSPGTYVVCTRDYGAYFKVGDVAQIEDGAYKIDEDCVDISKSVKNPCMPYKDLCKWFATKSEAEEFVRTLANEFVRTLIEEETKQPQKQAVHCKTQEEYRFAKETLGVTFNPNAYIVGESIIPLDAVGSTINLNRFGHSIYNDYNLLSFQEWCDLNGHKMESNIDLTGRHLKALIDGPQLTTYKKGDIVEIFKKKSSNQYLVGEFGGVWWTYTTNNGTESQWELLPEDYKMEKEVKFEVGKWYKSTAEKNNRVGDTYYGKFLRYDNGKFTATWHSVDNNFTEQEYTFCSGYKWELMTDLSEIDQYLPDGHPDKLPLKTKEIILDDSYVGRLVSFHYYDKFYYEVLVTKEGDTIRLLNNVHPNNNGHKDKSIYKHSLVFFGWNSANTYCKDIKLLEKERISSREFEVGDWVVLGGDHPYGGYSVGDLIRVEGLTVHTFIAKEKNSNELNNGFSLELNRHATPEEINNHLISIGEIPVGEPLNNGVKPNKDGMFKYTTYGGATYVGKTSTIPGPLKMTLSIDNEELPMVDIIKTNSIKQLLNND